MTTSSVTNLLIQIGFDSSPILQLLVQIGAFLAVAVQRSHSTAMGKGKDIGSTAVFKRNSNGIAWVFNEYIEISNARGKLYIKSR